MEVPNEKPGSTVEMTRNARDVRARLKDFGEELKEEIDTDERSASILTKFGLVGVGASLVFGNETSTLLISFAAFVGYGAEISRAHASKLRSQLTSIKRAIKGNPNRARTFRTSSY